MGVASLSITSTPTAQPSRPGNTWMSSHRSPFPVSVVDQEGVAPYPTQSCGANEHPLHTAHGPFSTPHSPFLTPALLDTLLTA
ncbi:hypothetical protein V492_03835 [Pseudogymnoascus sp. VKM F-4246]|nr:hypothetical protein V492_03835 [Pseudogymnoascus sp. VKM F-4246]